MAETLDRLSGGRLILGLGGGYSDEEFAAFGLPAHTAGEKIEGLEEAIHVIRGLWREVRFTFEGSFYRVRASRIEPKPSHRIPIWLGTFRPRGLDLTGRLADGWIPSYGTAGPDSVVRLRGRVMAAAAESGRNPDEILCVYNIAIRVGNGDGDPETLAGSADELVEQLARFRALGFGAFNLIPQGPDLAEQHERLAREVLPSARMS
jgi:alkanesulfonate monooxygenase SsuD/methylene tetrahydromethanopterin reductase-like flavin-dependent oxidoreductase (luciferase family)